MHNFLSVLTLLPFCCTKIGNFPNDFKSLNKIRNFYMQLSRQRMWCMFCLLICYQNMHIMFKILLLHWKSDLIPPWSSEEFAALQSCLQMETQESQGTCFLFFSPTTSTTNWVRSWTLCPARVWRRLQLRKTLMSTPTLECSFLTSLCTSTTQKLVFI